MRAQSSSLASTILRRGSRESNSPLLSHVNMCTWWLVLDTWNAATNSTFSGAMTPRRSTYLGQFALTARSHCSLVRSSRASASSFLTLTTVVMIAELVSASLRLTSFFSGMPLRSKSACPASGPATLPGRKPM